MRRLAASQISPGAETCIVVGAVDGLENFDLRDYRAVLWFARADPAAPSRLGLDPARLHVEFVDQPDSDRFIESLDRLIQRDSLHLPSVFVTDEATGAAAATFAPVIEATYAQCESHQRARITRQRDGFIWQQQLLTNLPAYAQRRVPRRWANALAGRPAIICGAGPSLDVSVHHLKYVAGRAVIFAADSALRGLARVGVTADFAVSVDAAKTPERCLVPGHASAGRVIIAGVSSPDWRHSVAPEKLHVLSGRQLTEDWLANLGLEKTSVGVEENCGSTALALALHLGCGPIYLFGMDHASDSRDPARWHHRFGPTEADRQNGFSAERTQPKVPGNYQAEVASPLYREWRALDARCAALPGNLVFNVTDRGARLSNTTLLHPTAFALDEGAPDTADALAALAAPSAATPDAWLATKRILQLTAGRAAPILAQARTRLECGDIPRTVEALTRAFRDPQMSRLFGNYSLKVLPHLLRPSQADAGLWRQLIDECDELLAIVRDLS